MQEIHNPQYLAVQLFLYVLSLVKCRTTRCAIITNKILWKLAKTKVRPHKQTPSWLRHFTKTLKSIVDPKYIRSIWYFSFTRFLTRYKKFPVAVKIIVKSIGSSDKGTLYIHLRSEV